MLSNAIESALGQDFANIELKVYDNCSGDETAGIVAHFADQDDRVKYYCHPKNIGAAANYSYALNEVRTPFFSFLADDDWLLPGFCRSALGEFAAYPAAKFVFGRTLLDSEGTLLPSDSARYAPGFYAQPGGMLTLLENRFPPWIGILFKTEALQEIGAYVTEADGIDFGFLLRASHLPFAVSDYDVAVFRRHSGSSCQHLPLEMVWPSHIDAVRAFLDSPRSSGVAPNVLTPALNKYVSWIVRVACTSALRTHHYEDARAAAAILSEYFGKHNTGLMLTALGELMQRSTLIEGCIDTISSWRMSRS